MLMEKDADVKLVDHTRKDLPSDTYGILNSSLAQDQCTNLTIVSHINMSSVLSTKDDLKI